MPYFFIDINSNVYLLPLKFHHFQKCHFFHLQTELVCNLVFFRFLHAPCHHPNAETTLNFLKKIRQ